MGFSGGSAVKNLPASAGGMGLIPDQGRSHVSWSNEAMCLNCWWACALEPMCPNYWSLHALESMPHNRSHHNEKPEQGNWRGVPLAKVLQLCLCDPTYYSLPGSSDHGILQTRILAWVAVSYSRGSSQPRDRTRSLLHLLCWRVNSLPLAPPGKSEPLLLFWFIPNDQASCWQLGVKD